MPSIKTAIILTIVVSTIKESSALRSRRQMEVTPDDLVEVFEAANITPHTIPYSPYEILHVKYPEKKVDFGNSLNVLDTLVEPLVAWNDTDEEADPDSLYTLLFINIEGGNPHFLHWMVTNIYIRDVNNNVQNIQQANITCKYMYPDPPDGLLPYTMLFLVYRQPNLEPYTYNRKDFLGRGHDRASFDLTDFLSFHNFTEYPIAGNFFVQYPRLSNWVPLDPPNWMRPFIPLLKKKEHPLNPLG